MASSHCPLCLSVKLSEEIYRDDNAIVSIGQITPEPVPFVPSPISQLQCLDCGYVFNSAFNLQKIVPIYASENYVVKTLPLPF